MGIKGIYKEIGQGERISLCKLATKHLEQTQRPFRLAIDISIWQFQVQAARGGSNPAIRTLFYRLARLLGNAVEPVFVFDGPNKPAFKRNKRSGRGDGIATAMAKRLICLFGFTTHDAPGEAEAECALLQQQGIVDAVLSEDVDTIMFGCGRTLRNWSAEGTKGAKTPTHVTLYDAAEVAAGASGLDREGMVLVALMSGGDYIPEGVPGCGIKVACEAARAGFGRELCQIKRSDKGALAAWKERLRQELRTNESRFFRTKHKALEIPESFPNMEVLRYYTHPVVSRQESLNRLKQDLLVTKEVEIDGLREFVRETFDWTYRIGAIKFIRVIAASLLVQRLVRRCGSPETLHDDLDLKQMEESVLVKSITNRRVHFSTDSIPELRVSFLPIDIVKVDLDAEPEEQVEAYGRDGLALNSDDEFDGEAGEIPESSQAQNSSTKKPFDPLQLDLAWIPESIVKMGVPLTACDWDDKQRAKEAKATMRAKKTTRTKKADMPVGALDKYVKVTKNTGVAKPPSGPALVSSPPRSPAPLLSSSSAPKPPRPTPLAVSDPTVRPPTTRGRSKQPKKSSLSKTQASKPTADVNPWTLASSQASPKVTKSSNPFLRTQLRSDSAQEPILIESSPAGPALASPPTTVMAPAEQSTPTRKLKRLQSPPTEDSTIPDRVTGLPSATVPDTKQPGDGKSTSRKASPQPRRRARPLKRTKSGAENQIQVPSATKMSIKSFARVGKVSGISSLAKKAPIEIPSDDEASKNDETFLPLSTGKYEESFRNTGRENSVTGCKLRGGDGGGDDPFGPETSSRRAQSLVSEPGINPSPQNIKVLPRSSSYQAPDKSDDDFGLPPLKPTTKLFLPRTSGVGAGFFDEVEVTREDANARATRLGTRAGRKIWRRSEISVVDLTSED